MCVALAHPTVEPLMPRTQTFDQTDDYCPCDSVLDCKLPGFRLYFCSS
jgi:hypothetical protein